MKVFKFGGASINTADRIRNVGRILQSYNSEPLVVVISAMGKTTNALEKVAEAFYAGNKDEALKLFEEVKKSHLDLWHKLQESDTTQNDSSFTIHNPPACADALAGELSDFFTEVEWLLHDKPVRSFDYYYDQIVCVGELLATFIISQYLNSINLKNQWIDVRDVMRTDNNFRDAKVDWTFTAQKVQERVLPAIQETGLVITQGFIGATDENESTTLGREGSDYTAAVFANLLNAESQTIWKDVQGVMNADPRLYPQAVWIEELNYKEVIEMAYYGAQVIHPKTIKPLQNKNIPLYVKSFLSPEAKGTCVHSRAVNNLPPIIVYKFNQALVQLSSTNYSFAGEGLTEKALDNLTLHKLQPNLTQTTAIGLLYVLDDHPEKLEAFALEAGGMANVTLQKGLTLLTVRHHNPEIVAGLAGAQKILLQQQTPETVQLLLETN